jgi:hypothetical protein
MIRCMEGKKTDDVTIISGNEYKVSKDIKRKINDDDDDFYLN